MSDLLAIYLNDHLAAAAGTVALARRVAGSRSGAEGDEVRGLAEQLAEDRDALVAAAGRLGVRRTFYKEQLALVAERIGRLKSNGSIMHRSPLSDVVEYEALAVAISAGRAVWRSLDELSQARPELEHVATAARLRRADSQLEVLDRLRASAVRNALVAEAGDRRAGD